MLPLLVDKLSVIPDFPSDILRAVGEQKDFLDGVALVADYARASNKRLLLQLDEAIQLVTDKETWSNFHARVLALQNIDLALYYPAKEVTISRLAIERDDSGHRITDYFTFEPESLASTQAWVRNVLSGSGTQITEAAVLALHEASQGWPFEMVNILYTIPADLKIIDRAEIITAVQKLLPNTHIYPHLRAITP